MVYLHEASDLLLAHWQSLDLHSSYQELVVVGPPPSPPSMELPLGHSLNRGSIPEPDPIAEPDTLSSERESNINTNPPTAGFSAPPSDSPLEDAVSPAMPLTSSPLVEMDPTPNDNQSQKEGTSDGEDCPADPNPPSPDLMPGFITPPRGDSVWPDGQISNPFVSSEWPDERVETQNSSLPHGQQGFSSAPGT